MYMSHPIADPNLAAELWSSLRALVASHAAMHTVASPQNPWTVLACDEFAITVASAHALLQWSAPAPSNTGTSKNSGTWKFIAADPASTENHRGTYFFTADGSVCFGNESETFEIEAAVERILSTLQKMERRA